MTRDLNFNTANMSTDVIEIDDVVTGSESGGGVARSVSNDAVLAPSPRGNAHHAHGHDDGNMIDDAAHRTSPRKALRVISAARSAASSSYARQHAADGNARADWYMEEDSGHASVRGVCDADVFGADSDASERSAVERGAALGTDAAPALTHASSSDDTSTQCTSMFLSAYASGSAAAPSSSTAAVLASARSLIALSASPLPPPPFVHTAEGTHDERGTPRDPAMPAKRVRGGRSPQRGGRAVTAVTRPAAAAATHTCTSPAYMSMPDSPSSPLGQSVHAAAAAAATGSSSSDPSVILTIRRPAKVTPTSFLSAHYAGSSADSCTSGSSGAAPPQRTRFAPGDKLHDGPHPLNASLDKAVWAVFTGTLGVPLPLPIVDTPPVHDLFAMQRLPSEGSGVADAPVRMQLRNPGDLRAVLDAMDGRAVAAAQPLIERLPIGSTAHSSDGASPPHDDRHREAVTEWWRATLQGRLEGAVPSSDDRSSSPESCASGADTEHGVGAPRKRRHADISTAGASADLEHGAARLSLAAPRASSTTVGTTSHMAVADVTEDDECISMADDATSKVSTATPAGAAASTGVTVRHVPTTALRPGIAYAAYKHLEPIARERLLLQLSAAAGSSDTGGALRRTPSEVLRCSDGSPVYGGEIQMESVIPPPAPIAAAVEVLYRNARFANGDALALRGLLILAEGLEHRLQQEMLQAARAAADDSDDTEDEVPPTAPTSRRRQAGGASTPYVHAPYASMLGDDDGDEEMMDEEEEDTVLTNDMARRMHELIHDPAAEAAARSYQMKRSVISVPVLPNGGGSSAKLNPAHQQLVHQLVLLLRHAVRAYPPAVSGVQAVRV